MNNIVYLNNIPFLDFGYDLKSLAERFSHYGFVAFRDIITIPGMRYFEQKANYVRGDSSRKDFVMKETNGTPRNMSVLSGKVLNEEKEFKNLYHSSVLHRILGEVTGTVIEESKDHADNIIMTFLEKTGDTHGWHKDQYPYSFILIIEKSCDGGDVEVVNEQGIIQVPLYKGDAYILRSDMLEHRVSPITSQKGYRIMLNFTYGIFGEDVEVDPTVSQLFA